MRLNRLVVLALVGASLVPVSGRAAAADFVVRAGAVNPVNALAPYDYTRFYPDSLRVHRGQVVDWKFYGFHTVSFLPGGAAAQRPALARLDELPGSLALNEKVAFGSGCGNATEPMCVIHDTNTRYDSGADARRASGADWLAKIDLPPGTYTYLCEVHPTMSGAVQVVDDVTTLPSQADIDGAVTTALASDTAEADLLIRDQAQRGTPLGDGHTRWDVRVGPDTASHHVSLLAYLPANINAKKGDSVRFAFDDNTINNAHTVTFPAELVGSTRSPVPGSPIPGGLAGTFALPACDLDDPSSGAPGIPGVVICPANFEVLLPPHSKDQMRAPNDEVVVPVQFHNSAIMFPAPAPGPLAFDPRTGAHFPSSFGASFPQGGTFMYSCILHGTEMTGRIAVS